MADRMPSEADEARARARERLAARQGRLAAESGKRPATTGGRERGGISKTQQSERGRKSNIQQVESHAGSETYEGEKPAERMERTGDGPLSRILATLGGIVDAIGLKRLAIIAGAVLVTVLLVVGIAVFAQSCSSGEPAAQEEAVEENEQDAEPIPVNIPEGLDPELTSSLEEAAAQNNDIAWIANHADDYGVDGDVVQYKLLKLAVAEPEAVGFVRGFPEAYSADAGEPYDEEVSAGTVPRLYQWDPRWGYTVFSSTTFSLTGCCPTALSMVYMGLTGKNDMTPYDMGVRAKDGGYMTEYNGTDGTFLVNEAPNLGLSCVEIGVSAEALRDALGGGSVVICNVGPGDFTDGGHYFVITGLNDDGTLAINDPYSAERSAKGWDVDQVVGQTKSLYSYALA